MSGQVIQPPAIINLKGPAIFLAGPIQGALDWQKSAAQIITKLSPKTNIANPRREYLDGEFVYAKQVDWETYFLNLAAKSGVILFWLAKEHTHNPERAYAQTTRFELAEWKVRHERDGVKLALGIEPGFSNERYIRRRFGQDCPGVTVSSTLEATCQDAVRLLPD